VPVAALPARFTLSVPLHPQTTGLDLIGNFAACFTSISTEAPPRIEDGAAANHCEGWAQRQELVHRAGDGIRVKSH
jgi:hypothetical protein